MSLSAETEKLENIKKRQDIVLGVCLAVVAGFLVNLFSNIYYDIFISKTLSFADISSAAITFVFLLLIFFEAFLEFLVYDVQQGQGIHINKRFWGRYFDFIDERHWASKATGSIGRIIWATLKWLIWVAALLSIISTQDWWLLAILLLTTILHQGVKYGLFRSRKKKAQS